MPSAEIITIGTELLLGEIVDTNSRFLASSLRDAGIDLHRMTTVGDNISRIAQAIQQALERCDIVITSGGLGPTVDDPTREAVARAVGVTTEYHPELWEQITVRFRRYDRVPTENNRRQAYIPAGATPIENPVGTAPIFFLEYQSHMIISLPGVPREMEYLMGNEVIPLLHKYFDLHDVIRTRVIHTVGVGESQIDDQIGDLEQLSNPTVGLAAHSGQVDVRITAKAGTDEGVEELIQSVERVVRNRLGDCIYGVDQETLEDIALGSIKANYWTISVVEAGLNGILIRRLSSSKGPFTGGQLLKEPLTLEQLISTTDQYRQSQHAEVGFGVSLQPQPDNLEVLFILITPRGKTQFMRSYGGPREYGPIWALNHSLDIIRRIPYDN